MADQQAGAPAEGSQQQGDASQRSAQMEASQPRLCGRPTRRPRNRLRRRGDPRLREPLIRPGTNDGPFSLGPFRDT
jgi:hypothetical protein